MNELNWVTEVHVGNTYKYEESYHLQAVVRIVKKDIHFGDEYGVDGFIRFTYKVIEAIHKCKIDEKLNCGKSLSKESMYLTSGMKFKDAESGMFDYVGCN